MKKLLLSGFWMTVWKRACPLPRRAPQEKPGNTIRLYYIGLDPAEESLSRIENRVRKGGHDIARDSVLRRFPDRFESAALYCDWAEFYDNDNGFVKVAECKNGEILCMGDARPKWLV